MRFAARYQDGEIADPRPVTCRLMGTGEGGSLLIDDAVTGRQIARWRNASLYATQMRPDRLRLGARGLGDGVRLMVEGEASVRDARAVLPVLTAQRGADRRRQLSIIGLATGALASVVVAYMFGVPLLSSRVVALISPQWETDIGEAVVEQLDGALAESGGLAACDPDPASPANLAIRRFVDAAVAGLDTPFDLRVEVVRSSVPNAFALPGGRIYFFRGLLEQTTHPDQFAGVLAHEIGHVVHRHGLQQLVSSAGTGLLVGLILGDVTGISVASAVGAMVIDTRFSREHELEADRFARDVAARLEFDPGHLADLLEGMGGDDPMTRALSLLNTHPLSEERRRALALIEDRPERSPAFTKAEWTAIRTMCED